jgi:hypothetical protein
MVSDFAGSELVATKENIFAHEHVVESCMDRVTPLPFRFGAVVSEDTLRAFIHQNLSVLRRDLEEFRDCVEMGLKVMLPLGQPQQPATGTDFLNAKRRLNEVQQETASWVDASLVGLVRRTDVSRIDGSRSTIVRIAHLVMRNHLDAYKSHLDVLVSQRTDCRFLRSGPWAPYSFISTANLAL